MSEFPKITFGIIVLNGEPFTRHCLRSVYPFAHEIIVVEGSNRSSAALARPDTHSKDSTLEALYQFKAEEDPQNKVQIIIQNGFWNEKDEQSQAYAERATGDYLWQVDIDEFYKPQDMQAILAMLRDDPEITAVSFKQVSFWGGFDYNANGWYLRREANNWDRLFKWGTGYRYVSHRPPTVCDPQGRDLRSLKWVNADNLAKQGILCYHYHVVFPKQAFEKSYYYSVAEWATHARGAREWYTDNFLLLRNPFRVHNVYQYPSWLEKFDGEHPPEILKLRNEIESGLLNIELRHTEDIQRLLSSKTYILKRYFFRQIYPFYSLLRWALRKAGLIKRRINLLVGV